jgi:Ca2+-binding EF-hand superfamily protein
VFDLTKVLVDDNEYADARSLILGLVNFIPTFSVFERCQMMLELFDDRRLGHVSSEDLKKVLAANHMRNINAVEKKAQTILKFVDRNGKGQLKQDDLLDAATKFPNLLFPRHVSDGK